MGKPMAVVISKITAPWSAATVTKLNDMQTDDRQHGYTCPGNYEVCKGHRLLRAMRSGWVCQCGRFTQDWAIFHDQL
jgi:hypothetical protein